MDPLDNDLASFSPKTSLVTKIVSVFVGLIIGGSILFVLFFYQPGSREVPSWIPKTAPPKPLVQLSVESSPKGAKVYMDDGSISLATTPSTISLLPGKHSLRFELPGFPIKTVTVDTANDKKALVQWDGVVIEIQTKPDNLGLVLDGNDLGRSPYTLAFPRDGKSHELKAVNGKESRVFVFQPTQNLSHTFDFTK